MTRLDLLNNLARSLPPQFHRADGGYARHSYYVYAWFHGRICIYVGKGLDARWLGFYVSGYTAEARAYIKRHARELKPFFVASALTTTAAQALEYRVIGHFKLRSEGGSLFNINRGSNPDPPAWARTVLPNGAEALTIPPGIDPLSNAGGQRLHRLLLLHARHRS